MHAVAGPYRSRSHFEAQDALESGADHGSPSGWLNRASALTGGRARRRRGLAVGVSVPLLLRGPAPVGSFAPDGRAHPPPDLYRAVAALHRDDPAARPGDRARALRARGFPRR